MIFILTGPVGSGKTRLLERIVSGLRERGIPISGFLSRRVSAGEEREGYDLVDVKTNRSTPLLRKEGDERWPRVGAFYFVPDGLNEAWRIIRSFEPGELILVDEVGPAELEGGGLWPALKHALFNPVFRGFCVVRSSALNEFKEMLGDRPVTVFEVDRPGIYEEIMEATDRPS